MISRKLGKHASFNVWMKEKQIANNINGSILDWIFCKFFIWWICVKEKTHTHTAFLKTQGIHTTTRWTKIKTNKYKPIGLEATILINNRNDQNYIRNTLPQYTIYLKQLKAWMLGVAWVFRCRPFDVWNMMHIFVPILRAVYFLYVFIVLYKVKYAVLPDASTKRNHAIPFSYKSSVLIIHTHIHSLIYKCNSPQNHIIEKETLYFT